MRVFQNKMLRSISGPQGEKVKGEWSSRSAGSRMFRMNDEH
jgi:hypothetical protein